ncbi:hypothetical protein [Neisseria sicca]|uniref:hypothetical protein n=1 Tax=Neisseria sicca TaxID=490 RepID=UPI00195BAF08|nr:hypothetical protein [Neisseria sicca]VTX49790.1 Uncharacterised protein [Neisseria sicca]
MRKSHVDKLLTAIREELNIIKKMEAIDEVKFKSILENLRSSLEYIAQDINSMLSKPKDRIYFPYGKTKENFEGSINKNLSGIQYEYPKVYDYIESLQSHKNNGDDWLITMCSLTNHAKHNGLIELEYKGNNHVIIHAEGVPLFEFINVNNGEVILKENTFFVSNDDGSETNLGTMGEIHVTGAKVKGVEDDDFVSFSIVEKKKLVIDGKTPIEVIPFLEKCFNKISQFSTDVYTQLK